MVTQQHRARGTGEDPSLHCWHQTAEGWRTGNTAEYRAQCCQCGQLADVRKWLRDAPIEGHGEHYTQPDTISKEVFGYSSYRLPYWEPTPLFECADDAKERQEAAIVSLVDERRKTLAQ